MTFGSIHFKKPISKRLEKTDKKSKFIIHGQGVYLFHLDENIDDMPICMIQFTDDKDKESINIYFTPVNVFALQNNHIPLKDDNNHTGIITKKGVYYWISLDSHNCRLSCGIGEARIENRIYNYQYEVNSQNKAFLEKLVHIHVSNNVNPIRLLRDPITKSVPM